MHQEFFTLLYDDFTSKGELFLFTVRIFSWIPRWLSREIREGLNRVVSTYCLPLCGNSRGMCKGLMERIEGQRAESLAPAKKSRCWKVNEGGIK